jgi:hypothetical protein
MLFRNLLDETAKFSPVSLPDAWAWVGKKADEVSLVALATKVLIPPVIMKRAVPQNNDQIARLSIHGSIAQQRE